MLKKIIFLLLITSYAASAFAQTKTIHIVVALCDNKYQGIVPVPEVLGNGQEANNNLYWGAAFGLKTFLNKQKSWQLLKVDKNPENMILERLVYKHKNKDIYIIADAYDGRFIKNAIEDFLNFANGSGEKTLSVDGLSIDAGKEADLVIYVGHNGLMDINPETLSISPSPSKDAKRKKRQASRYAAVFACKSQQYFSPLLSQTDISPAILTTGYMAPEGYAVYPLIEGFSDGISKEQIRSLTAKAYSQYQNLKNPAMRLFTTEYR
jgi:hypothetical protein